MCYNKGGARIHFSLSVLQSNFMQYRPEGWSLKLRCSSAHQRTQMVVPTCEYVINPAVTSMRTPWNEILQIYKHTHEIQKSRSYYHLTIGCSAQVWSKTRNPIYNRHIQGNWRSPELKNMTYEWLGFRYQ